MRRLKYSEVKEYRSQQLAEQDNRCALCGEYIQDDAVLDHDHATGEIRSVLHRGCNSLLGKIENNMTRNRVDLGRLSKFAENLISYLTADGTDLLHPTYKTKEERKMAYKKRKGGGGKKRGY